MAYLTNPVVFGSTQADAFGRGRVSQPQNLFIVNFTYDANPLLMQVLNVGAGTGVKTTNVSSVTLATGGNTSGDGSILQQRSYNIYQPGKSQFIQMTGIIGAAKANVRSQIGYYDVNNGLFFDQNNGLGVTVRTNTSGSPVDTFVAQASWNLDTMSGAGGAANPSGVTLDATKTQIFVIDFQWLGVGRVRFGLIIAGTLIYVHQVLNANVLTVPWMNTACLPIRWEIHNTGTASGTTSMTAICGSVQSEGGQEFPAGLNFNASNEITSISVSTKRAVLSIRPKTTFNSLTNRMSIVPVDITVIASSGTVYWELIHNATLGGSPAWTSADANRVVWSSMLPELLSRAVPRLLLASSLVQPTQHAAPTSIHSLVLYPSVSTSRVPDKTC
jgi:hypothetical protein